MCVILSFRFIASNKFGSVEGSKEQSITFAPNSVSHKDNQLPLKPV